MKKGGGRVKGTAFERTIAIAFRSLFPKALRQLEFQQGLGVDLQGTGNLQIQCKRGRKYASLSKIEEVPEVEGTIPLLVTQGDRKETLVALRLADFLEILKNPSYVKGIEHGIREKEDGRKGGDSGAEGGSSQGSLSSPSLLFVKSASSKAG